MYTTTDIYREMLELGMIDNEEYAELICEYRNHVNALMKMDAAARNAKETIGNTKKHEEKAMKEFDEIITSAEYVGYMRTSLRK